MEEMQPFQIEEQKQKSKRKYSNDFDFQIGDQGEEPRRAYCTSQATNPQGNDSEEQKQKSTKDAYNYAIRLLGLRDYSKYKMHQKLHERGYTREQTEEVVEKLIEMNYLREAEYARMRMRQLLDKGYAPDFIVKKCQSEHLSVTNEDILSVQEKYEIEDADQIQKLIDKKLRFRNIPTDYEGKMKLKNKVMRFLLAKGYRYDQVKEAVEEGLSQNNSPHN